MNESIKKLLENYMKNNDYNSCNDILKKEITYKLVKLIQVKDSFFVYSNIVELLENAEIYLTNYQNETCKQFYKAEKFEYDEKERFDLLIKIYEKLN